MTRVPGSPLTLPVAELVARANAVVPPLPVDEAHSLLDDESTLFVDIREPQEWAREGIIPGAYRAPRGMLEFWIDPESPYHKPALSSAKRLVLYCQSGWRSALATATLLDMGVSDVCHVGGGFSAWKAAGAAVAEKPRAGA